jgi:hypothetical protein
MNSPTLDNLPGHWKGTSRLFFEGDQYDSLSTADIHSIIQSQFINISYTWEIENESQDGQITFLASIAKTPTIATWLDSWHMRNKIMVCEGTMNPAGTVSLLGSYAAPPSPDWGWRIEIELQNEVLLVIRMLNISPEGEEELAVLAQYHKDEQAF